VTANDNERDAVLAAFGPPAAPPVFGEGARNRYSEWRLAGTTVVHLHLDQQGPISSNSATKDAFHDLDLQGGAVLAVGIAFGFEIAGQQIGTILVSQAVQNYAEVKFDSGGRIEPRSHPERPTRAMLRLVEDARETWSGQDLMVGLIISGPVLVNFKPFRDQLREIHDKAIGGEMEGSGIVSACIDNNNHNFLIIKAICDWGTRRTKTRKVGRKLPPPLPPRLFGTWSSAVGSRTSIL
jgi:nucleoside phosphorylase